MIADHRPPPEISRDSHTRIHPPQTKANRNSRTAVRHRRIAATTSLFIRAGRGGRLVAVPDVSRSGMGQRWLGFSLGDPILTERTMKFLNAVAVCIILVGALTLLG